MITHLFIPTNIPATPPPAAVPTLGLSGLQLLDDPGIGGNTAIAHAALRHYGEYYRPDGVPWVGWCEMFVENILTEAGIAHSRYGSAILDAISGPIYRGNAPAGSLVFFDQRSSPYGHVGISLGDGTMLSALGGGVVRTTYGDWISYLGWRPFGALALHDGMLGGLVQGIDDRQDISALLTPPMSGSPSGSQDPPLSYLSPRRMMP